MGRVLRVLQFFQREVGRHDQRLVAAVSAVNHVVNLFKPVFRAALHAEIIKDKQGEAAKAVYVFVPVLIADGKVVEDKGKVCHAHGNLTLHEGIGDTPGKIAFSRADIISTHWKKNLAKFPEKSFRVFVTAFDKNGRKKTGNLFLISCYLTA